MTDNWGQKDWFQNKLQTQGASSGAAYFGHANNAYQNLRHQWILENTLKATPFRPEQIFDFGCAGGELTSAFTNAVPTAEASGYDFIEGLIDQAKINYPSVSFDVNALPEIPTDIPPRSLTILSEVLYYLPEEERKQTIANLSNRSKGPQCVALSSVVGERYFTAESAVSVLKEHYPQIEVFSFSMPIYKRIYGICQSYEALCGLAETGADDPRSVVKLTQKAWRFVPTRLALKLIRSLTRRFIRSNKLVSLAMKVEGRSSSHQNASNILVIAHRDES